MPPPRTIGRLSRGCPEDCRRLRRMKPAFCTGLILLFGTTSLYPAVAGLAAAQAGPTWAIVAEVTEGLKAESPDYKSLEQIADRLNGVRLTDFPGDPTGAFL